MILGVDIECPQDRLRLPQGQRYNSKETSARKDLYGDLQMGIKKTVVWRKLKVSLEMQQKLLMENRDLPLIQKYGRKIRHLTALLERFNLNDPIEPIAFDD